MNKNGLKIAVIAIALAAIAGGLYAANRGSRETATNPKTQAEKTSNAPKVELAVYEGTHYRISYPKAWKENIIPLEENAAIAIVASPETDPKSEPNDKNTVCSEKYAKVSVNGPFDNFLYDTYEEYIDSIPGDKENLTINELPIVKYDLSFGMNDCTVTNYIARLGEDESITVTIAENREKPFYQKEVEAIVQSIKKR